MVGAQEPTDESEKGWKMFGILTQQTRVPHALSKASLGAFGALLIVTLILVYSEINALRRTSIPLYGNLTFGVETLRIGNSSYYYLLLSSSALKNDIKITFHGVTFTYVPSIQSFSFQNTSIAIRTVEVYVLIEPGLDFAIKPLLRFADLMTINKTDTYFVGRYSRYFLVEFSDGELELVPILPWNPLQAVRNQDSEIVTANGSSAAIVSLYIFGFTTHQRVGVFQIGPSTMMLLVSTNQG